jgi:site-specific DNA-adenine methylase
MRLPLFILKSAGSKSWFVPHALQFLGGPPWPRTIVEPFAGSAVVGFSLLNEGCAERLVIAEKDKDCLAYWKTALGDPAFSYRVATWTRQVFALAPEEQEKFVEASLERMKSDDPGLWILLRSRVAFNGKKQGGYMKEKNRDGIRSRWPLTLDTSLDLLYSLRNKITVMDDGFEALAACDSQDSYAFVDPPYTMSKKCPGHELYDEAIIDHDSLHRLLVDWKGRWQLTYNACAATSTPVMRFTYSICERTVEIADDGTETVIGSEERILKEVRGVFCGVPGLDSDYVKMNSGRGSGGSKKKFEMVVCKALSAP